MNWKMKSLGIMSVVSLALVGCGDDKKVETTVQNKTGTTEEKSVNKTTSTDSKSTGENSEEFEGGGRIADPKNPFRIGKVEKQLGNESFTNFELGEKDKINFIVDGDNLGILFEKDAKPYISSYTNGKWTKDKSIDIQSIAPGSYFLGISDGTVEVENENRVGTHIFVNYKGDVVFKDVTNGLQRGGFNEVHGSSRLKNSITSSSKGNVIIHRNSENEITLLSQKDGKEIEKLNGAKDFPANPGYLDFDKKLMVESDEIYDYKKKEFIFGEDGQRLRPDKNGKVAASNDGKYFFSEKIKKENSNGITVGHFDLYEQKLGSVNERKNKIRFTGPFEDEESYVITSSGDKIYFYGYYKFKDKPSIYMTEVTYKNNKSKK